MMMYDLGMECPIGAMRLMRKRGKEHAKHRNPNPTSEEIWHTKHRNPCLRKSGSARNAESDGQFISLVETYTIAFFYSCCIILYSRLVF